MLGLVGGPRARGREADMAAHCLVPYLAVQAVELLVYSLLGHVAVGFEQRLLTALPLVAAAIPYAAALLVARTPADAPHDRGTGAPPPDTARV